MQIGTIELTTTAEEIDEINALLNRQFKITADKDDGRTDLMIAVMGSTVAPHFYSSDELAVVVYGFLIGAELYRRRAAEQAEKGEG